MRSSLPSAENNLCQSMFSIDTFTEAVKATLRHATGLSASPMRLLYKPAWFFMCVFVRIDRLLRGRSRVIMPIGVIWTRRFQGENAHVYEP